MPVSGFHSLVLECICWDKDRFGKDYMGEFNLALEEVFEDEKTEQPPRWFPLKTKRPGGKKSGYVSGDVQLQFTLYDPNHPGAKPEEIMSKFWSIAGIDPKKLSPHDDLNGGATASANDDTADEDELYDEDESEEPSDGTDDPSKPETAEKKKRRMRIRGLKRKKQQRAYEFANTSDVVGIVFMEIGKVTDLPPEKNLTRTSFDMDPFVVASLGKKTYRTRVIRHNLNPVFNEKMIFHVLRHEQTYSIAFTIIDRDKLSGNDFIASATFPLSEITHTAVKADPNTGLYELKELPEPTAMPAEKNKSRFKLPLSRSNSSQSLSKMPRPGITKQPSDTGSQSTLTPGTPKLLPVDAAAPPVAVEGGDGVDESDLHEFNIPLKLKNLEKWEEKHSPKLCIKAKYVPYPALRQQFWRSMLKQYDTDESGMISKVELTTMLDTLGSTLKESTIDSWFDRFSLPAKNNDESNELTVDQVVICLEDQLQASQKHGHGSVADKVKGYLPDSDKMKSYIPTQLGGTVGQDPSPDSLTLPNQRNISETSTLSDSNPSNVSTQDIDYLSTGGEEGDYLDKDDLNDRGEEHVVEIRECPICHQPRLNKRSDADIITHIATCASQDWRQVNNIVMAGFVTSSQAQRKWYSKVITKISYGGYKLGANSANILVQDRITGQINEERMSVYVRLGIRLLYKGLKSRDMETKKIRKLLRSLSIKQGVKYDDPASRAEIPKFINFHQLDITEVLRPLDQFKTFNEFFYRELKPGQRPCSAPENPRIIVSPADCRSVVFNKMDEATKIWVKGREFSIERLLGNAYPEDAKRYVNGALGIFRLAPQDYHRFHIPVDGVLGTPKTIEGEYYTVNPMAIRSALDVYGENVRVVVPLDSVAHGRVMVICVGAMMVGSTVITRKAGEKVKRAEELGYFKFGGSTILCLFEPGAMKFDDDLVDNSNGALETLVGVLVSCYLVEEN